MEIEIHGERLLLDHRRALIWPDRGSVLIADTHFGKSAIFRREGLAVPEGSDASDLERLGQLVRDHGSRSLYILGDFVHGALPRGHDFYEVFNHWCSLKDIEIHVVLGNHDVHLERSRLRHVQWHTRLHLDPFQLIHEPQTSGEAYFIAGHVHPVTTLSTRSDSLRMPVFWRRRDGLVLPSFGGLTGGYRIAPRTGENLYAVGPEQVTALPERW